MYDLEVDNIIADSIDKFPMYIFKKTMELPRSDFKSFKYNCVLCGIPNTFILNNPDDLYFLKEYIGLFFKYSEFIKNMFVNEHFIEYGKSVMNINKISSSIVVLNRFSTINFNEEFPDSTKISYLLKKHKFIVGSLKFNMKELELSFPFVKAYYRSAQFNYYIFTPKAICYINKFKIKN